MSEFNEIAYDEYIRALYRCQNLQSFDDVMFRASEDSDISHRDFVRLCKMSKFFMLARGILQEKE